MTIIRFQGVQKRYGDLLAADIDRLEIGSGQIVCFVGPSGCGKTTALRMVAGLIRQDAGDIRFDDRVVNDLPPERRNAAMVFQNYALFPHMTVGENVAFGLTVRRRPVAEIEERVRSALELVQLPDLAGRYPRQLSGGQQQRVAVARALATHPDILLFDEPLSNLDAKLREYMRFELRRLLEGLGVTTIYVTHDQTEAMVVGDRMVVMNAGRIVQDAPPSEVYRMPATRFVADFIGTASFVEGRVAESGPSGLARLEDGEGLSVWGRCTGIPVGQPAAACLRPESVLIGEAGQSAVGNGAAGEGGSYRAVVRLATDLGEMQEVHLALGRWSIHARAPTMLRLAPGDAVTLRLVPERCTILAA